MSILPLHLGTVWGVQGVVVCVDRLHHERKIVDACFYQPNRYCVVQVYHSLFHLDQLISIYHMMGRVQWMHLATD